MLFIYCAKYQAHTIHHLFYELKKENTVEVLVSGSPVRHSNTTTHDSASPLTPATTRTSVDDNNHQEREIVSATTSTISVSRTPITMPEIVKRIDDGDAKSILINKDIH